MASGKDESADAANAANAAESQSAAQPESQPVSDNASQPTEKLSRNDLNAAAANSSDFGPPVTDSDSGFGPPLSEFGPPQSEFGPPLSEFGPPLSEFGPAVSEFGPPQSEFGQPVESGASGWSPAPAAPSPEMGWRPVDAPPSIPAPPPQYRAPDSSTPTVKYGPTGDPSEATVRFSGEPAVPPAPPKSSGWAPAGGIKTAHSGRESSWLRSADAGMPSGSNADVPPASKSAGSKSSGSKSGGAKQESLSWADDPIAQMLAPKNKPAPTPVIEKSASPKRRTGLLAGAAVAVIAIAAAVVAIVLTRGGGSENEQAGGSPATTIGAAGPTSTAALSCPARKDGNTVVGNGPGSVDTGAGAILGFQHGFYTDRSGTKARSFVAPDSPNVSPAETIQQAIDKEIPVGTTYCLRIVEIGPEVFDADLTEHRPDGTTTVYRPRITTVNREGKHLIFEIQYPFN